MLLATWLVLLGLTVLGPSLDQSRLDGRTAFVLILVIAWLKLVLIVRNFMDTRHAHFAWLAIPSGLAAVVLALCFFAVG